VATAWPIVRASRAKVAFTGEGPWRYGGRWNSPGVRVVYVSEHQSTAALEIFVHRVPFVVEEEYKAFQSEWPDSLMEFLPANSLLACLRISPPPRSTMEIGDRWIQECRSAVLALPSAISPADTNFLLNSEHADFKRIRIYPPTDYDFNPRLLGR
jgi:RES domain-containing protein